jgi:hypothetical protein
MGWCAELDQDPAARGVAELGAKRRVVEAGRPHGGGYRLSEARRRIGAPIGDDSLPAPVLPQRVEEVQPASDDEPVELVLIALRVLLDDAELGELGRVELELWTSSIGWPNCRTPEPRALAGALTTRRLPEPPKR